MIQKERDLSGWHGYALMVQMPNPRIFHVISTAEVRDLSDAARARIIMHHRVAGIDPLVTATRNRIFATTLRNATAYVSLQLSISPSAEPSKRTCA